MVHKGSGNVVVKQPSYFLIFLMDAYVFYHLAAFTSPIVLLFWGHEEVTNLFLHFSHCATGLGISLGNHVIMFQVTANEGNVLRVA